MRRFAILGAVAFFCFTALTTRPDQASAAPYTLTANGVWQSHDGLLNGTWEGQFDVAGYDMTGTLNFIGMPGIGEGNVSGTWNLSNIDFGIVFLDQELLTFEGGLQGNQFVGTFDTGDFTGMWNGLLTSIQLTNEPITPAFNDSLPTLLLNHSSGQVGQIVDLIAKLYTVGQAIDRIDNILSFDPSATPILSLANGRPNCSANPLVNPFDVVFEFLPQGCSGNSCNQVRAVLDSLDNLGHFLDGVALFTCKVKINDNIPSGVYSIIVSFLQAFDIDDLPLDQFESVIGQISVKTKEAAKKLGCDCSIMETSGSMPLASLLAPFAILAFRRMRTRGRRELDDQRE